MKAPHYSQPGLDPLQVQAGQQAQDKLLEGLQTQSRSDTASLMARYGALAMANGALTPAPSSVLAGAA